MYYEKVCQIPDSDLRVHQNVLNTGQGGECIF